MTLSISVAQDGDVEHAELISGWYLESSKERGTGIAVRTPEYLTTRIRNGNSVIAKDGDTPVGFCYIEVFQDKQYVSNSGLIIHKTYRGKGLSRKIKTFTFNLAREKFPNAKIFGITTSEIVMRLNSELGYLPVPLYRLTQDLVFWNGCSSCKNYHILTENERKMCLCTGMLYQQKATPPSETANTETDESKE